MADHASFMEGYYEAVRRLQPELARLRRVEEAACDYESALRLIAIGKRVDGTYNRSREACEELARAALAMHEPQPREPTDQDFAFGGPQLSDDAR